MKTILTTLLFALFVCSCSSPDNEQCGADYASDTRLLGTLESTVGPSLVWSTFTSSENNDCTLPDTPTSLLLEGIQENGDKLFTICLPRPDLLSTKTFTFGEDDTIQVISLFADTNNCLLTLDVAQPLSGNVTFSNVCENGLHPDGYNATFNATFPVNIVCDDQVSEDVISLMGTVAVDEVTP